MWVYNLDTLRFIAVNDAAIEHYGYARSQFLAMTIPNIRPAEDVPAIRENLDRQAEELERSGVWRHRRRDGTIIELTESVLMEETDGLVATLRNLQAQGVQLVLDDFGTGYSALGYLHRFPIDGLKIDRSFIAGIGTDVRRTGIVRAVIDMARALVIEVVAEGVE